MSEVLSGKRVVPDAGAYPDLEESNPHPSVSAPKENLVYVQIHTKSVISLAVSR